MNLLKKSMKFHRMYLLKGRFINSYILFTVLRKVVSKDYMKAGKDVMTATTEEHLGKMQRVMAKPARTMMKSVMVEDTMLDTQKTFEEQQIQEGKVVKVMSKGQSAGHCAVVYDACSVVKENGQQCGEKDCCEHLGAATVPRYRVRIQLVEGPELADSMWADVWGDVAEGLFKMSAPEMNNLTGVEVEDAKAGTMGKVYELTLRAQYREAKRKSGAALQFV